jgi:hypothetical protein
MKKSQLIAKLQEIPSDPEVFVLDAEFEVWQQITVVGLTKLCRLPDEVESYVEREVYPDATDNLGEEFLGVCLL